MDAHLKRYLQTIATALAVSGKEDGADFAVPIVCMMHGALTLSRLLGDKALSDKVLKDTRDFILSIGGSP
jgi:hypothetical protein